MGARCSLALTRSPLWLLLPRTENAIVFPWQRGDTLILNNIRFGHARLTVVGQRRIVAAMGSAYDVRHIPYRASRS